MTTKLLAEIQQSKPFASLEEEALLNLWRTHELLARASEEFFKTHGITGTQYNVLRILRGAGPAGATCGEIADRMIKADPDITRLLDRMEQRGFILRGRDSRDRRVVLVCISAAGAKLLAALDKPAAELVRRQFGGLGRRKLQELIALLEQVRAQQAEPGGGPA